jgi:hypothetical protein
VKPRTKRPALSSRKIATALQDLLWSLRPTRITSKLEEDTQRAVDAVARLGSMIRRIEYYQAGPDAILSVDLTDGGYASIDVSYWSTRAIQRRKSA